MSKHSTTYLLVHVGYDNSIYVYPAKILYIFYIPTITYSMLCQSTEQREGVLHYISFV